MTFPAEMEVWKFIVLTSEQDLVCVEVAERGFILKSAFPREGAYIFLDNLQFVVCTKINHKDLSFENFEQMVTLDQSELEESKDFLMYDTFRLCTSSEYKMATA